MPPPPHSCTRASRPTTAGGAGGLATATADPALSRQLPRPATAQPPAPRRGSHVHRHRPIFTSFARCQNWRCRPADCRTHWRVSHVSPAISGHVCACVRACARVTVGRCGCDGVATVAARHTTQPITGATLAIIVGTASCQRSHPRRSHHSWRSPPPPLLPTAPAITAPQTPQPVAATQQPAALVVAAHPAAPCATRRRSP